MENQYLCDLYRVDYEKYLRQAILFSTKVNVMYPAIKYPRDIDNEFMLERISSLEKYKGFYNVNIIPMKSESNRYVDFEHNPILLDTICRELCLTEIEKECFLEYRDQEIDYLVFNRWAPWKEFCSYMHNVFNTAIAYTDMTKLFCDAYSNCPGNVLSNSNFLHELLSSNVLQEEKIKHSDIFQKNRKAFSGKYCSRCKEETKQFQNPISPISVKEKVIEILIPDYSELEVEDLYEIQLKANSEIEQLATYIDEISVVTHFEEELDRLVKRKITPSVSELRAKVDGLRLTSLQKALSIKNIASIPLLVKVMPNLPDYIPILLSAGFIAADAGIEIRKECIQLKQDPLYFTIRLNKLAKRKRRKH